ncbi:MAG: hypothetical protein GXO21_00740 [Aquificae bacterium]|nr:hypothetical protein [Aquificota bacterium]
MLKNLYEIGHHPFEIQALLLSYINKLLLIFSFLENRYSVEESLEKAGIKYPFQKNIYKKMLSIQKKENLIQMLKDLYSLEKNQKIQFEDIEKKLEEFIISHI